MSTKRPLSEADLRAALEELASNPLADAERVLRALPQKPATSFLLSPLAASMAAMAAGFLVGFLIWGTGSTMTPSTVDPAAGQDAKLVLQKTPDGMRPAFAFPKEGPRLIVCNGAVTIKKRRKKGQKEDNEAWPCPTGVGLPMDSILATGQDGHALLSFADGSDIILDNNCELQLLSIKELSLKRGEIWTRLVTGEGNYIIHTPQGRILIIPEKESGEAVHDIKAEPKQVRVVSLRGSCKLVSHKDKTLEIVAGFRGLIISGEMDKARKIKFLSDYGEWRRPLLAFRPQPPELEKLLLDRQQLVRLLGDEREWMRVDSLFRRMDNKGVDILLQFLLTDDDPKNEERRAHAAGIISNTADARRLDKLFHLLLHKESRVRVSIYFVLARLLGYTHDTDEVYWARDDLVMAAERRKTVNEWMSSALKEHYLVGYRRPPRDVSAQSLLRQERKAKAKGEKYK